jgi:predicted helicase
MTTDHRADLAKIKSFPQLIAYLRDEMGWPIARDSFEEVEDLFYDFTAEELGIDPKTAAKIESIKRLRPLSPKQPWGIFFVKFEPKKLPVIALRRILNKVALKKRASANSAESAAWAADDLLFISNYGEGEERQITFAHFSKAADGHDLPTLRVLGWDNLDTALHLDVVAKELKQHLAWPEDDSNVVAWRKSWRAAFNLRHREVVTTSQELSIRLAELARAIRDRINAALAIETEAGPLTKLMKAFQEALVHDLDAEGFADMYAQTIAYGLLSARIADPEKKTADDFAAHMRTNPFLRELMETFLKVGGRRGKAGGPGIDFDELGVSEVVELLDDANMEAVVLDFGDRNPQEDPVIHFYELFLKEYDAKKRMQRGVFYTPRPVVSFIVRSIHELLRTAFDLEDGLADISTWGEVTKRRGDVKMPAGVEASQSFIQILDPATGTGTFLVEAIDLIHKTLVTKWKAQGYGDNKINSLWNEYVPKHLLPRLHGYELLMAPYAIAHLKIGLKLYETGYRFGSKERARIYLTNALEPPHDFSGRFEFLIPALAHEAQAVNEIKRKQNFTVVMGNPPYAKLSQNQGEWIDSMMERYKTTIKKEEIQRQALSNDYVKFFCLASTLLERAGAYVLGMITDNSYLDGPLFRDMRENLIECYQRIHITDLGGNSRRTDATAADQNVFDIQQGVAIFLGTTLGKTSRRVQLVVVRGSRDEKASWLSSNTSRTADTLELSPAAPQRYFVPTSAESLPEWETWLPLPQIFAGGIRSGRPLPFNGAALATRHDALAIAFTREALRDNLESFFDKSKSHRTLDERFGLCSSSHFDFKRARSELTLAEAEACIRPILYRPFDKRYVVYHPLILGEPRAEVMKHLLAGSLALLSTRRVTGKPYDNVFVCRGLVEYKAVTHDRNTQVFPLKLVQSDDSGSLFSSGQGKLGLSNISPDVLGHWKDRLNIQSSEQVFYSIYAILFSPEYRRRFREGLQRDYARVPQPLSPDLNRELMKLGSKLISLHLMDSPVLDDVITTYVGPKKPEVESVRWSDNTVWLDATAPKKGQLAVLGTVGVHGVPEAVWNFHIGGYQVCEKWLKDRKGRTLSNADVAHYQKIVLALTETIRLMKEIDEVIETHGGWPGAFWATM